MPDHLLVIRSAATDYERQGRVRGSLDVPPSAEGLADVAAVADRLSATPPEAIYTAPTACGIQSGRILGNRFGIQSKRIDLLANLDLGLWQGKLVADIRRLQPRLYRQWQDDPWTVAPPEGELLEDARSRVEEALEKLFKRHPTGRIAVVVPAPLDAVVRWLVAAAPLGDLWQRDPAADPLSVLPVAAQWLAGGRPVVSTVAAFDQPAPAPAG
ncbi:MAG: Phosphoserine phosphatase 1 [Planctomycetota bacterium]